jgi:hypothetical protein
LDHDGDGGGGADDEQLARADDGGDEPVVFRQACFDAVILGVYVLAALGADGCLGCAQVVSTGGTRETQALHE